MRDTHWFSRFYAGQPDAPEADRILELTGNVDGVADARSGRQRRVRAAHIDELLRHARLPDALRLGQADAEARVRAFQNVLAVSVVWRALIEKRGLDLLQQRA